MLFTNKINMLFLIKIKLFKLEKLIISNHFFCVKIGIIHPFENN